jgi:hypothetical protein
MGSAAYRPEEASWSTPLSARAAAEFTDWREGTAEALDAFACVLISEEGRVRARAEATAAREQASGVRRRDAIVAGER